jgi:hypothetical protein
MNMNPFTPPRAAVADIDAPGAARITKPMSVWLVQITSALGITALTAIIAMTVDRMLMADHVRWVAAMAHLAIDAGLLMAFTAAFVGAQRRASYGRRLGLALIGLLFLLFLAVIVLMQMKDAQQGLPGAYVVGELAGGSIWLLLCVWWWRAFGYSKASRAWFHIAARNEA